jgi:hypothetical protein
MADIDNILHNEDDLNEKLLIKYLEGNLSEEERFTVESQMADSAFVNDAVEGLESFSNKENIQEYVTELNRNLQKHTHNKKRKKEKRKLPAMDWILTSLVIILLLCVLGYLVIKMIHK